MAKPKRAVEFALEEADSALTVLETTVARTIHSADRKEFDRLIGKARAAIERAQTLGNDIRRVAQEAIDQL